MLQFPRQGHVAIRQEMYDDSHHFFSWEKPYANIRKTTEWALKFPELDTPQGGWGGVAPLDQVGGEIWKALKCFSISIKRDHFLKYWMTPFPFISVIKVRCQYFNFASKKVSWLWWIQVKPTDANNGSPELLACGIRPAAQPQGMRMAAHQHQNCSVSMWNHYITGHVMSRRPN